MQSTKIMQRNMKLKAILPTQNNLSLLDLLHSLTVIDD